MSDDKTDLDDRPELPILTEVWRVGANERDDEVLFGLIKSIDVNSEGHIYVADWRYTSVYVFSETGEFMDEIGRRGRGPGEFWSVGSVSVGPDDFVYVFDSNLRRVTMFEPEEHRLINSFTVVGSTYSSPSRIVGVAEHGIVISYISPFVAVNVPGVGPYDQRFEEVYIMDFKGAISESPILRTPYKEFIVTTDSEGGISVTPHPFGRDSFIRLASNNLLYAGWNESIDIRVVTLEGITQGSIRLDHTPVPITMADRNAYLASIPREGRRKRVSAANWPDTEPAFQTFTVDDRGRVWLKSSSPAGASTAEWLIINDSGDLVGTAELPVTIELEAVKSGRAYGKGKDVDTGAPFIVAYTLGE